MKKLFVLTCFIAALATANAQVDSAEITFESTVHDFGTVKKGAPTTCRFKFSNTGKSMLIISGCQKSCGCTTPTCPDKPIYPGETGFIEVHYDSLRVGGFSKTVTVTSNAKTNPVILTIKGTIVDEPAAVSEKRKE